MLCWILICRMGTVCIYVMRSEEEGSIFRLFIPSVSYTHLDVYKRQVYTHPTILLGDELTGNLDSRTSASVMELLSLIHILEFSLHHADDPLYNEGEYPLATGEKGKELL